MTVTQSEMDREVDGLRRVIESLGRRGYICKSELCRMLPACRATGYTLSDLEALMRSLVDPAVEYIDDTAASDSFHVCDEVQKELEEAGFRDVFEYLRVEEETTLEGLLHAYRTTEASAHDLNLYTRVALLLGAADGADSLLEMYRDYLAARLCLEELRLRGQFLLPYLSSHELEDMVCALSLGTGMDPERAAAILRAGMLDFGLFISDRTPQLSAAEEQLLDEFLIPIQKAGQTVARETDLIMGFGHS